METSSEEMPRAYLLESLAAAPYLIKVALGEARDEAAAKAAQADLREIEAALSLLRVAGWRSGEPPSRPPFVRRNLLLLHAHLHRERLRALDLASSTCYAIAETVDKARRLLDMALAYCLKVRAAACLICPSFVSAWQLVSTPMPAPSPYFRAPCPSTRGRPRVRLRALPGWLGACDYVYYRIARPGDQRTLGPGRG